jgi:AICAR transformylase/IMP cyclohydrolase PurH
MPSYKPVIEQLEKEKISIIDLKDRKRRVSNTKENVIVVTTVEQPKEKIEIKENKLKIVVTEKQSLDSRIEKIKNAVQKIRKPRDNDRKIVELW